MASDLTISIDAMGGDDAPGIVVEGLGLALVRHPGLKAILFGDERAIAPLLQKSPAVAKIAQIRHTEGRVSGNDKPSEAVRRGRQTSMWLAIDAVRNSEAAVAVSAGNTGALMAMAKIQLKTMPGITRPAIAAIWPTVRGQSVVLDLGANSENDEKELVDFAIMGEAFARVMFGLERPTVGLLNIGTEELKGREEIRAAAQLIRDSRIDMNFAGFVEGSDIGMGKVDVVVADGFTGNVALKTAEGTAKQIAAYLRASLTRSLVSKLGALLARGAFETLRAKMDPRTFNGGVFLGLNGLVVKSHGGTDGVGFASALDIAVDMASSDFARSIADRLTALGTRATGDAPSPSPPSTIGSAHGSSYTAAAS